MSRTSSELIDKEIEVLTAQLATLERREDEFTRLVEEMVRLQTSVRAEREALSSRIIALECQKQPINWLPTELLIEIFLIRTEDESADLTIGLPHNPAPVLISHVCRKWRELALTTPILWSYISYRVSTWNQRPLSVSLQRSVNSLVSFNFISSPTASTSSDQDRSTVEATTSMNIIQTLCNHSHRFRSLAFECGFAKSMENILTAFNECYGHFRELQFLDLSLSTLDPSFEGTQLLTSEQLSTGRSSPRPSKLRHLRLQQLPLSIFPSSLIRTIHILELSYPPKKSHWGRRHRYSLKMSQLITFLRHTPQLQQLSLIGVNPIWDVVTKLSRSTAEPSNRTIVSSFELPELKHLEWKLAYYKDIFPFLSLILLPKLEHWDLLIALSPTRRLDATQVRGSYDQDVFTQAEPISNVLVLQEIIELNLQCHQEDSLGWAMRQLLFPSLTKLEITFIGQDIRKDSTLPPLPRLETIFRDPRFPFLTQLSVSNFDITPLHGKSMLGYMPNLLSLTLTSCTGVNVLLEALAEAYGHVPTVRGVRPRVCGVRVCPKLEDLILWSCTDFDFKMLWSTVHTRSLVPDDGDEPIKDPLDPDTIASAVLGREIRPLKKMRNSVAKTSSSPQRVESGGPSISTSPSRSTMIPMQEALHPTRLICLHLEDCHQISHHEALSLGRWGTMVFYR